MKTIGILGGMGPGASSVLYQKIITYSQTKYSAVQDTDYPKIILYSLPLYGFDETGIIDKKLVLRQLKEGLKILEKAGADFIVIACNTVHSLIKEMRGSVSIPIVSIIELALQEVQKKNYTAVGLLSSETTRNLSIYKKLFRLYNFELIQVNNHQQKILNNIIESVMAGKHGKREAKELLRIAQSLVSQGAEAVILGCTELPLAINQTNANIPMIDTLNLLAEASVDIAKTTISFETQAINHKQI